MIKKKGGNGRREIIEFIFCFLIFYNVVFISAIRSDQIRSVAQSCPTLCNPMNRSTPGLPLHYQLPEFTQTHVHRVSDAIQPSHPLSSPSPPAPNPSQHQSLFQWVKSAWGGQSIGVSALTSVLPMNTQGWSSLGWTVWISLQSKGHLGSPTLNIFLSKKRNKTGQQWFSDDFLF